MTKKEKPRLIRLVQLGKKGKIINSKDYENFKDVFEIFENSDEFTNGVSKEDYAHKRHEEIVAEILQSGDYEEYHDYDYYTDEELAKLS